MFEPDKQPAERKTSDRADVCHSRSVPVLDFDKYAEGGPEILVEFRNQRYRLRVTRNGGLILNK